MASELGLAPPAAKRRPPPPTTIIDIGGDLLRKIFFLLPSLPSLVRAALSCGTFLHAVRSCPGFRRRFQMHHPPQILGFFFGRTTFPTFAPLRSRSDPDLAAAVRGSDFFLTRLPHDSADSDSGWGIESCHGGHVVLVNKTTGKMAAYNPLTQALDIFPLPRKKGMLLPPSFLECHIVISEEHQGVFRMVFAQLSQHVPIHVSVFSSATRQWLVQSKPQAELQPDDDSEDALAFHTGMQVNGFIYWKHTTEALLLALDTATLQLSTLHLPASMKEKHPRLFRLGQRKDGKLCLVSMDSSDALFGTLCVWVFRPGADGVEEWTFRKFFPLYTLVDTEVDARVYVEAVIDGFVYLSVKFDEQPDSLISVCLKTGKPQKLFDHTYTGPAHPYIMMWPPSLLFNKASLGSKVPEDSRTKVTGGSAADAVPVGSKEISSALVVGSQEYRI